MLCYFYEHEIVLFLKKNLLLVFLTKSKKKKKYLQNTKFLIINIIDKIDF